ncbi:outer membrane protein assembly factor BamB family protein [Mariniphaga sediminis]|uniref:outer membrane protein assembly factor BamB family protein n=1 Tax=Mariniphaga sediminis TaxID=1628158 RepID=UPI003564804B
MKLSFILFTFCLFTACTPQKSKIYQWRGEGRKGVFDGENLLTVWPENGPEEVWFAEGVGNGYGSPTITDNKIFITGEVDSMAWLYCYDINGNLLWKEKYGKEWSKHYPGSRSAPTVVDDLVYVETGMGVLACLKSENGEMVWSKDFVTDFGGILPIHGFSEAPVVNGEKVFCMPGGKEHNVVALNRYTGELIWSCKGRGERSAYNPGNLIELPERNIFVTFSAYNLLGIDAETGELLWAHQQENTPEEKREPGIGDTHSNNVIFENGHIYYAVGDGNCGVKLQLSEDGTKISELWRTADLDTYMSGFVKMDNYLYGCGTRKKDLKSFDAMTGEVVDSLKTGTGAVVAAGNMLYYYNWRGELLLLSCENGKLQQKSSFKISRGTKEHFSHPVIKNGILYQRRGNTLMAFDIRNGQEPKV